MKKTKLLFLLITSVCSLCFYSFKKEEDHLQADFTNYFRSSIANFLLSYDSLYKYTQNKERFEIATARDLFIKVRYAYKKNELFITYFAPATASMLNMALIPKVDEYDPNQNTIEPEGLQKIEELLYANDSVVDVNMLIQELKRTRGAILRGQQISQTLLPQKYQLFEASKQELIRIWTLNLTGIDATFSKNSVLESKYAIMPISDLLNLVAVNTHRIAVKKQIRATNKLINEAAIYLSKNNSFDSLNRLFFVKKYINKIYSNLTSIELALDYEKNSIPTAINYLATSVFDPSSWNIGYFTSEKRNTANAEMVELGKMLFYDPILSGNNQRACASCHQPNFGFAEPIAKSKMFGQTGDVNRNAPSLLNVGFQKAYFLDARTTYLEDQVVEVSQNANEMHGNFDQLAKKLNGSEVYRELFKKAFKGSADSAINKFGIIKAISAFERSLVSMNSKFDRYMRNEKIIYTTSEINGFNLFMGKAQCGTCHFAPLFNGTVPPNFDVTEWEIIGVPENKNNQKIDLDNGRFNVAQMVLHRYAFKTPSVRNISYTSPYMHNGVYQTLNEVVDFYNHGAGMGHGYPVPNQTIPSDSLNLNQTEITELIAFLNTLNDTVGLTKKPASLPEIKIQGKVIVRKIGGEY